MITYISYLTNLYGHKNNNNNNNNNNGQIKNKNKTTNKIQQTNNNNNNNNKINDKNAGKQDLITNSPIKQNRCSSEEFRYKPLSVVSEAKRRGGRGIKHCKRTASDLTPWLNRNFSVSPEIRDGYKESRPWCSVTMSPFQNSECGRYELESQTSYTPACVPSTLLDASKELCFCMQSS